jgi:thiamine transport system substrate-binding protein
VKKALIPFLFLAHSWGVAGEAAAAATGQPELVIYTYDSFVAPGGLGPEIFPLFEKICGCRVRALASGDGGQLLSRLQLDAERGKPGAQVVLGIDQELWERAKPWLGSWKEGTASWTPRGYGDLIPEVKIEAGFLPFDYGVLAFMADRQALKEAGLAPPTRLSELLKPEWRRQILLQDPRTSTPGLMFLLYSNELLPDFWPRFRGQWLALAPGWSQAYGLFLKKEAPLVWSYTSSQAYHEEKGDDPANRRYEAVLFEEGQPLQVEGAALVASATQSADSLKLARSFLEFLLTPEVQEKVPRKNWMFPVLKPELKKVKLPPSFENLPRPRKIVRLRKSAEALKETLTRWRAIVQ